MKIAKRLLPFFALILAVIFFGCSHEDKQEVKAAIKSDLDLLKNLDSDTTNKYISYKELFPDATENTKQSDEINEVFSLFFQDFNYKILDIDVDSKRETAKASLRLVTLDARALAEDFAASRLKYEILEAADDDSENTEESSVSLQERYLILGKLLKKKDYKPVERNAVIELTASKDSKKETWEIKRTYTLENDLVGGLMTYLSDPDILSPEDTLTVYLKTLKKMNQKEMSSFLGVESLLNSSDSAKNQIASALVDQVHNTFDYKFTDSRVNGYNAAVTAEITTFDSEAILTAYQEQLDRYLASPDAVIDGSAKRLRKCYELLCEVIEANQTTRTTETTLRLINDGASWKLSDDSGALGSAIFGTLTTTPVDEAEEEP